jgi:serine/threonine protein kinase
MATPRLSPDARGAATAQAAGDRPAAPRLPDRYRLEQAGRVDPSGGAGIARDGATGERVFLKWSSAPDRLIREAAILKVLDHPGIVRLRALRRGADQGVLVLDLVEGQSLEAVCAQAGGRLDADTLTALARELALAVAAIHQAGYLHRDLKPGNVVVRPDGRPVIVDLGAALPLDQARAAPPDSLVTDGYAAPEQYLCDQPEGPWTDVYGLGALCYRALTGHAPPPAPQRLRGATMTPALEADDDYPEPLRRAIDRALALPTGERPQSVAEWAEMLDQRAQSPGGSACRPPGRRPSPCRSHGAG